MTDAVTEVPFTPPPTFTMPKELAGRRICESHGRRRRTPRRPQERSRCRRTQVDVHVLSHS